MKLDPAAEELFHHLARLIAEPLLGVSPEGTVLLGCPGARRLLGEQAMARDRPLVALAADPPEKVRDYLQLCARTLQPLPGSLTMRGAAGDLVPCRCKGALLAPPPSSPAVVVLRLSPRQGAHSPFTLLNQQIADLTREVMHRKRAEQEALAAVRLRDEFVSIASHELKTPLHSLKLQLELIDRMLGTLDPLTSQRLGPKVDLLRRQVDRLGVLSNRLLDVSALRAGRMTFQPQPLALAPAVHAVVERVSSELEKAGCQLSLELEADTSAVLDPSRFEQILVNLLSNAAKYGAGQPIEISVRSTRDQVVLSVRDHGIGIAEEDLQRIFGKFERAISAENYGGLGLGLYITKQLVEGMDGHIRATSTVGRGSTFTVEFPRAGRPPGVQQ